MKSFIHHGLRPLVHVSGWPWMRAKCCGERVNHCGPVIALPKPEKYGDTQATHTQKRSCECGKTTLIVEGTLAIIRVYGCFAVEEKRESK